MHRLAQGRDEDDERLLFVSAPMDATRVRYREQLFLTMPRGPPTPPRAHPSRPPVPGCDPYRVARTWNVVLMRLRAGDHRAPAHPGDGRPTWSATRNWQNVPDVSSENRSATSDPVDSLQGSGVILQRPRRRSSPRPVTPSTSMLCPPGAPTPVDGRNQSAAPWPPTSDTSGAARPRRGAGPRSVPSTASTLASGRGWPYDHLT